MSDKREVRLIDANALCTILEAKADMALVPEYKHAFLNVQAMVNAIPTIDVVPMDVHRKCMEAEIKKRVLTEKTNRRILENYGPSERASLNTLRDAIYEDAVAHGLWESTDYTVMECIEEDSTADPEEMMRGWAMETIRREVDELEYASADAEEYAEELADVIIASLSVAGKLDIDIDAAVRRKMEINKARPWKHGKEKEGES